MLKMCWFKLTHKNVSLKAYLVSKKGISRDIIMEKESYVGPNCRIYPNVRIGRYSMLAYNVSIIGGDHNFTFPGVPMIYSNRDFSKVTRIGDDVWIGANSIILTGVKIGDGSIIAAGSVVTKDVEEYSVYGGVPAKEIKKRFLNHKDREFHQNFLRKKL